MPKDREVEELHVAGRQLLLESFAAARESGRTDWRRMTLGVLKNRILAQTNRRFDQREWGANTFGDFVLQFADVVRIEPNSSPPVAELLPSESEEVSHDSSEPPSAKSDRSYVRNDLWTAILDYSGGLIYVWYDGIAVPLEIEDAKNHKLRLPTLTRTEMETWRADFVEQVKTRSIGPLVLSQLEVWLSEFRTASALPTTLRREWLDFLKIKVIDRIVRWFESNKLTLPSELTTVPTPRTKGTDETESLRDLLMRCVRVMSRSEMESLRIPPAVILRMRR
jgi:hypothetical protein